MKSKKLSTKLKYNWLIDAVLFLGALLAILTGIYFLVYPVGGFMGGRNPDYGIIIMFGRETWEVLHDWTGIAMIAGALVHIVFHYRWIWGTLKRIFTPVKQQPGRMGSRLLWTIVVDALIALGFIVSAVSGVYFFFAAKDANWLMADTTWDMLHTWGSILLIVASLVHIALHWSWIKNITAKMFGKMKKTVPANAGGMSMAQEEN